MNEYEEAFISHACALVEGLRDMLAAGRLTKADIPDDFAWLTAACSLCEASASEMDAHADD